jgi:homocitrate synthase NifV
MIRITDMTLSCIADFRCSELQLQQLYTLLLTLGTDYIEIPAGIYEMLRPVVSNKVVVRIETPEKASLYPEAARFVCRMNGLMASPAVTREIQMNDIRELSFMNSCEEKQNLRITGLDDIFCNDYELAFHNIMDRISGRVEFCPENSCACATAAALEWAAAGGTDLVASFGGLNGKAALEEVLLSLRIVKRHRPAASYEMMPQIAQLIEEITGTRFSDRKAVIGRSIFNVESGIHIDGILKKPQMYEPFSPELVGRARKLVVGKHSGRKSIAAKLHELGYTAAEFDVARLLGAVRDISVGKTAGLTDEEFQEIVLKYRL